MPATLISTFHYGSIKIMKKISMLEKTFKSTFHYGSIKIDIIKL